MTSTVFSSLSKGYGSWDNGDLEARDDKTLPKPILPNLLEAEDVAFKDKSLNIPLRTKTPQSMVAELIKTKNVMPPPEDTYTVYSRPKTANSNSPRYPAATPRAQSSPARIARVKSAPPTSSRQQKPTKPNGELVLPKTFLTRRGAMLLFTAPEDLKFSQEQKCYQEQERSADVFDLGLKLRTMNKLTASVLQYGQDLGPETDFESYSSHYDKTFIKFPRETDDESAMDIHAQPGGDYSFYLRDLQVRTQGGMGYRPSSGRSVTSELERAELTEELRKMDAGDASSHGYRITADVNQLTEPYTQPSSRPSSGRQKVQKSRKPTSAKAVLSAMKLAASLKSANYLGRSFGSPYLPMTITPWERVDTPSDLIDVPMGASDSTSRPQTADLISLRSRRSLTSAGSGVGQRSETGDSGSAIQGQGNGEEVFESTTDEPIRDMYLVDEPITALDTDAIGEDTVEPITDLIETIHSDNASKADEQSVVSEKQIIECDDNDVDIDINIDIDADVDDKEAFDEIEQNETLSVPAVGEHNEILSLPAVSDPGIEDKGDVEQANNEGFIDGGRISRAASVPVSMATEGEEYEWMGQNVEEERPLSAMSAAELEKLEEQRLTTTPASERARSAASSRKPSVAGSEKARSVGSRPGSRPGSVMEPTTADSRPGSVKAESGIGSERGRSWVASESVSVRSEAENDGIEETINAAQPLQAPYQVVMTTGDEAAGLVQSEAEPVAEDAADTMAEYTAEPSTVEPSESGELIRPATAESQKPATPGSEVNSVKSTEKPQEAEDPAKSSLPRKTATTASGVPKDVLVIPQEKTTANQKDADKSTNQKALSPANQKPATPPAAKKTETLKDVQDTTANKKQDSAESAKSAVVKTPTPPKQARKISVPSPRASTTVPPTRPVSSKKETPAPAPPPQPKKEGLDLSELKSLVTKKNDSSEKPKSRKAAPAKKEKKRKGNKMQFVDSLGIESYGPSKEEIELMVQEELAKQLAAKNLTEMAPKDSDVKDSGKSRKSVSVASKGDSGIETTLSGDGESVIPQNEAEDDEKEAPILNSDEEDAAIEAELKQKFGDKMKTKKSKKQIMKERAALKEAKLQERKRREEERRELAEKKKQKEEEKRREVALQKRRKMMAEEAAHDAAMEAEEARQAEEEARQMLQDARKKAREERDAKRKAEMERRKQEREAQREERRRMEEDARKREKEMLERLASAEERRKMREKEEELEWEREEQQRLEEEERQRQEEEERKRMEEEEEKIRELERQAEEEAMARLIRDRLEAEERKRQALEQAERERIEEEMRRQEEILRQQEEEERRLRKELEDRRRFEEEKQRLQEIQRIEMEAREKVRQEVEKRRAALLQRREHNLEHMDHLNNVRQTQGMTRPWVFSYYVHWPRDTYEKPLPSNEDKKKKGFRPRAKAKAKAKSS